VYWQKRAAIAVWNKIASDARLRQYFHVSRHLMSIIKTIRFIFMSQKARVAYIMRQVESNNIQLNVLPDNSEFHFTSDGFGLDKTGKFYFWNEIEQILAYKVDLFTTDDVRLDISFPESTLTISEDIPGFSLFVEKLIQSLPGIAGDWEEKVIHPPFASNQTIIYKKQPSTR
jgi:hypothetical protein